MLNVDALDVLRNEVLLSYSSVVALVAVGFPVGLGLVDPMMDPAVERC